MQASEQAGNKSISQQADKIERLCEKAGTKYNDVTKNKPWLQPRLLKNTMRGCSLLRVVYFPTPPHGKPMEAFVMIEEHGLLVPSTPAKFIEWLTELLSDQKDRPLLEGFRAQNGTVGWYSFALSGPFIDDVDFRRARDISYTFRVDGANTVTLRASCAVSYIGGLQTPTLLPKPVDVFEFEAVALDANRIQLTARLYTTFTVLRDFFRARLQEIHAVWPDTKYLWGPYVEKAPFWEPLAEMRPFKAEPEAVSASDKLSPRSQKRRGAPRLKDRADADDLRQRAQQYKDYLAGDVRTKAIAAQLAGFNSQKTADRHVKELLDNKPDTNFDAE
jgi:hypothetical protein